MNQMENMCVKDHLRSSSGEANIWKHTSISDRYLWYHPYYGVWFCATQPHLGCNFTYDAYTIDYNWFTITSGYYIENEVEYYDSSSSSNYSSSISKMSCLSMCYTLLYLKSLHSIYLIFYLLF